MGRYGENESGICGKTRENMGKPAEDIGKQVGKNMEACARGVRKQVGNCRTQWILHETGVFTCIYCHMTHDCKIGMENDEKAWDLGAIFFSAIAVPMPVKISGNWREPGAQQGHTPSPISPFSWVLQVIRKW